MKERVRPEKLRNTPDKANRGRPLYFLTLCPQHHHVVDFLLRASCSPAQHVSCLRRDGWDAVA